MINQNIMDELLNLVKQYVLSQTNVSLADIRQRFKLNNYEAMEVVKDLELEGILTLSDIDYIVNDENNNEDSMPSIRLKRAPHSETEEIIRRQRLIDTAKKIKKSGNKNSNQGATYEIEIPDPVRWIRQYDKNKEEEFDYSDDAALFGDEEYPFAVESLYIGTVNKTTNGSEIFDVREDTISSMQGQIRGNNDSKGNINLLNGIAKDVFQKCYETNRFIQLKVIENELCFSDDKITLENLCKYRKLDNKIKSDIMTVIKYYGIELRHKEMLIKIEAERSPLIAFMKLYAAMEMIKCLYINKKLQGEEQ